MIKLVPKSPVKPMLNVYFPVIRDIRVGVHLDCEYAPSMVSPSLRRTSRFGVRTCRFRHETSENPWSSVKIKTILGLSGFVLAH